MYRTTTVGKVTSSGGTVERRGSERNPSHVGIELPEYGKMFNNLWSDPRYFGGE